MLKNTIKENNTVMEISWELPKKLGGGRIIKSCDLYGISPVYGTYLWKKRKWEPLQKSFDQSSNLDEIDIKHCMDEYDVGGSKTKNWFVRFHTFSDYKTIRQIEYDQEHDVKNELGEKTKFKF